MKRILIVMALALLAVTVSAQSRYYYDSERKYGFFSNWNVGLFGQASFYHGTTSVGAGGLALKQLDDYCRFRAEVAVNGIKPVEGFDRAGTALAGLQFNFVNWAYVFAEAGAVINPSMAQKAGLAGSVGLGLSCNFGRWSGLLAEGGYDALQNGAKVDNMFYARIGYFLRPGITERDRVKTDIAHHNAEQLGELKQENALLKTDLKRQQEANDTLIATLNKATELFALMEKRLDDCNAKVVDAEKNKVDNSLFEYYFEYAVSELSEIQEARIKELAKYINSTDDDFRIEGYASPDGSDYNNQRISQERAFVVWELLKYYGVEAYRLVPMGNGVSYQYSADSPLNRRVVVTKIVH